MPAVNTLSYPVADLDAAKKVFGALLGVPPHTDEAYYVGYTVDGQEIALDPNGHRKGLTGGNPYWSVANLGATLASLVEARRCGPAEGHPGRRRSHRGRPCGRGRHHDRTHAGLRSQGPPGPTEGVCRPPRRVPG